jgi:hypothetical protein
MGRENLGGGSGIPGDREVEVVGGEAQQTVPQRASCEEELAAVPERCEAAEERGGE